MHADSKRYGIGSFVYRARRPFDPLKLYRALEDKFILLQDESEDMEDDDGDSQSGDCDDSPMASNASTSNEATAPSVDSRQILANKKKCLCFRGLHRSKGVFWLATRPHQMGSWSTAGAMLTLGSEMPWFCNVEEEYWMADVETVKNIKADFEGEWGDRRQELVFIGEKLDEHKLTKLLDGCLLSRAEMRKWERAMHDSNLGDKAKEERLQELWDDSYWAEWPRVGQENEEHGHDHHGHAHVH